MPVYSVSVSPSSTTIKTDSWYYNAYAVVNASSDCCMDVEWYSDNPSVATVNATSGYIYGVNPGTARIYARSKVDGSKKDYMTITVKSGTICVESVCLNITRISLEKGDSFPLTATVCPESATNKGIDWYSLDSSVATVSGGTVIARGGGSTHIYAIAQDGSGEYDTCYVEVTEDVLVSSITLNHTSYTLNTNGSVSLVATVHPENATNKSVKWSSNKTSVATVNPDSGLVMAQGEGTAIIRAEAKDSSGKYAECTITVNEHVAVTDIDVSPTGLTMNVDETKELSVSITPSNATNKSVTWQSSNEDVATVGLHTGKVTAKKAGTTIITATTADGGFQACCEVEVYIDTVTIQKDGNFNKVVFNKTGKVWRCINRDMIYNENDYMWLTDWDRRSNYNFFTYYDGTSYNTNDKPREYTDDEIKLLYAIDPHGVADYIKRYADREKQGLEATLKFKDEKFRLLFNREPRYFARTASGVWYQTTDKSNPSAVQSESESIFGMHPIWDSYTIFQIIEAVATMVSMALTAMCFSAKITAFLGKHKNIDTIIKIFSFTAESIGSGIISGAADNFIEEAFDGTSLSWAYDIVSLYTSLNELVSDFNLGENYYPQIFANCSNNLNYNIYVEFENGEKHRLKEISELISNN